MAEIGLGEYLDEVKGLIRARSIDGAIAICRHILERFPNCIVPYRLLGEAAFEKGEYDEAATLFRRALGANPEDVIAHVGLAMVHDEKKDLEEAIWHLERAFELAPGNKEIRQELKRLYGEREEVEPPRVKLTPAALARLYLRAGLYDRAITELRPLIKEDPDRMDLKVALAEALWREGRRREAAETCQEILEILPNCLKANLILGVIWKESGQEEKGETLFAQAQALDPENRVAQELFGEASPLPPERLLISRLEGIPSLPPLPEVEEVAVPEAEEAEAPEAAPPPEEIPDWLRELREPPEEVAPSEEIPTWLERLVPSREAVEEEVAPPTPPEELPDWLREPKEAPEEVVEEGEWEEVPPLAEEEVELAEALPAQPVEEEVTIEEAPPIAEEIVEEAAAEEAAPTIEGYLDRLAADPEDHEARLGLARAYLVLEERDEALTHYRIIIHSATPLIGEVIEDLEAEVQLAPEHLPTQQLLGDAYMKSSRLQEALEKYRWLRGRLKR